jgi:MFS family permease
MPLKPPNTKIVLSIIVISQFCCTSLWFASNGVMNNIISDFGLSTSALGHLTSAVQLGFISGTLAFALLTIADRFPPSRVFFFCALIGSLFNLGVILDNNTLVSLISFRFLTGFFLAGIYPVGMKVAADYFDAGLGKSLGYLVGALVVGTAFPHLLKVIQFESEWETIIIIISAIAVLGGTFMILLVPNGPYRKSSQKLKLNAWLQNFKESDFRAPAFGYFGHMWELYAFWAFVPVILSQYSKESNLEQFNIPLWSFIIIASGGISSVIGGYLSQKLGEKRVAFTALLLSCICCLLSPLAINSNSINLLLIFLLIWGMSVISDSPLFSTLVAKNAIPKYKGTALTIVNCFGFAITIFSIQLLSFLNENYPSIYIYMILALGPILGLISLTSKTKIT